MPVEARRLIRKMRGGAQAHLIEAADGRFYVVKFRNNPQHRRILVNEWLSAAFLDYLRITTATAAIIELTPAFLEANSDVFIQLGTKRVAVEPGWHFGSLFPGDPATLAVYDFLPDALLPRVVNPREFLGILVADKWLANADSRQCVFYRAQISARGVPSGRVGFVALMIDHGYGFNGPHWQFQDSPLQGLYFRPNFYQDVRGYDSFEPWLGQVRHFPWEVIDRASKQLPPAWIEGDEASLQRLLEQLMARRSKVAELVRDCTRGRYNPFPNWT